MRSKFRFDIPFSFRFQEYLFIRDTCLTVETFIFYLFFCVVGVGLIIFCAMGKRISINRRIGQRVDISHLIKSVCLSVSFLHLFSYSSWLHIYDGGYQSRVMSHVCRIEFHLLNNQNYDFDIFHHICMRPSPIMSFVLWKWAQICMTFRLFLIIVNTAKYFKYMLS